MWEQLYEFARFTILAKFEKLYALTIYLITNSFIINQGIFVSEKYCKKKLLKSIRTALLVLTIEFFGAFVKNSGKSAICVSCYKEYL